MPTLIPGEGNCVKVLEFTSMISNAAEKLADMTGGMAP